jgi:hypothetical protein
MTKRSIALIALFAFALTASPRPAPAAETRHHIKGTTFAAEVQQKMTGMQLKLNNHNSQTSFVEVGGFQLRFDIPRTVVDIDCGTLCPDLGDAHFYINDVNLQRGNLTFSGSELVLALTFEGSGREVKGYHNKLGDDFVPDFQLNNLKLTFNARPVLRDGGMALAFANPRMDANVSSTGGCHVGGIDLCNKVFGSNRKIQKSVESSALNALNGNQIQNGLKGVLQLYLVQQKHITDKIVAVNVQAGDIIITTQGTGGATTTATTQPLQPAQPKSLHVVPGATLQMQKK